MKEIRISDKSFLRTGKRFGKLAKNYLNNMYVDDAVVDHFGNEFNYYTDEILNKLYMGYKMNPYKNKSGIVHKITIFKSMDDILDEFKISYEFTETELVFKLFTRYRWRNKRKVKFVLKIK